MQLRNQRFTKNSLLKSPILNRIGDFLFVDYMLSSDKRERLGYNRSNDERIL